MDWSVSDTFEIAGFTTLLSVWIIPRPGTVRGAMREVPLADPLLVTVVNGPSAVELPVNKVALGFEGPLILAVQRLRKQAIPVVIGKPAEPEPLPFPLDILATTDLLAVRIESGPQTMIHIVALLVLNSMALDRHRAVRMPLLDDLRLPLVS